MPTTEQLVLYREAHEKAQSKYREQARYLRAELGITTVEKAVEFMRVWLPTQKFSGGVMRGECASVLLTIAILDQAVLPDENRQISYSRSELGAEIYFKLKEESLW
ncbi:hypothetical protein VCHA53O466_50188 [Vibrio chagasii]|nr:hypothetical protein VCHA53O466_50188 [Vibrio chagasii]